MGLGRAITRHIVYGTRGGPAPLLTALTVVIFAKEIVELVVGGRSTTWTALAVTVVPAAQAGGPTSTAQHRSIHNV